MSYQISVEQAMQNAGRIMKETGASAIKLEGGKEVCPQIRAITAAGIPVVLAKSFSRSFYRNGVNNGLLLVECDTEGIEEGGSIRVTADDSGIAVHDLVSGLVRHAPPLADVQREILAAGGLVSLMLQRKHSGHGVS